MQLCIITRMDEIAEVVGELLKRMTQSEIARRTGISQSRVSRWAAGRAPDALNDARKLRELLDEVTRADRAAA